ncbi:hypothetical protein SEVIR_7G300371v4 [Setaria viridis]
MISSRHGTTPPRPPQPREVVLSCFLTLRKRTAATAQQSSGSQRSASARSTGNSHSARAAAASARQDVGTTPPPLPIRGRREAIYIYLGCSQRSTGMCKEGRFACLFLAWELE